MTLFNIEIPILALSVNSVYRIGNHNMYKSKIGCLYQEEIVNHFPKDFVMIKDRIKIIIEVSFISSRNRDIDNILKPLLDCFNGRIFYDDSQIDEIIVSRVNKYKNNIKIMILKMEKVEMNPVEIIENLIAESYTELHGPLTIKKACKTYLDIVDILSKRQKLTRSDKVVFYLKDNVMVGGKIAGFTPTEVSVMTNENILVCVPINEVYFGLTKSPEKKPKKETITIGEEALEKAIEETIMETNPPPSPVSDDESLHDKLLRKDIKNIKSLNQGCGPEPTTKFFVELKFKDNNYRFKSFRDKYTMSRWVGCNSRLCL